MKAVKYIMLRYVIQKNVNSTMLQFVRTKEHLKAEPEKLTARLRKYFLLVLGIQVHRRRSEYKKL